MNADENLLKACLSFQKTLFVPITSGTSFFYVRKTRKIMGYSNAVDEVKTNSPL
jgi:hypothetical protein